MKKLLTLLLLSMTISVYSQVEIKRELNTLKFQNQKEIIEDNLPVFINRLEKYYNIDIEYYKSENTFLLKFKTEIKEEELDGILSHFNLYNYKIIKL